MTTGRYIDVRPREYLTSKEIDRLIETAYRKSNKKLQNVLMIQMMFQHALRVSEMLMLKWYDINFDDKVIHIRRVKNSNNTTHLLTETVIGNLHKHKADTQHLQSKYVFPSPKEPSKPLSKRTVHYLIKRLGDRAGFEFPLHPHMLRHATGYYMSNVKYKDAFDIQAYMGHKDINNTAVYVSVAMHKFKGMWD